MNKTTKVSNIKKINESVIDEEILNWKPIREKCYNLYRLNTGFKHKIALISMICSLKQAYDKSNKKITFYNLIDKLAENSSTDLKEELANLCSVFYSEPYDFDNYGLKSAKEMKIEINKILNLERPF